MNYETRTKIIEKINDDLNDLTDSEVLLIVEDPELDKMLRDKINEKNLFPTNGCDELIKKYGLKKEYVELLFASLKQEDDVGYYEFLFNSEHRDEVLEYAEYADGYELSDFVDRLAARELDNVKKQVDQFVIIKYEFDNPELIDYIIKKKAHMYVQYIIAKEPISKELEDYVLEALDSFPHHLTKLSVVSPAIKQKVIDMHYYDLYTSVLDLGIDKDIDELVLALNAHKIPFTSINFYDHENLYNDKRFIPIRIEEGDYIGQDDAETIKNDPVLKKRVEELLREKIANGDYNQNSYFSIIINMPDLFIMLLENIVESDSFYAIYNGIFSAFNRPQLKEIYDYDPERFTNAVISYMRKGGRNMENILSSLSSDLYIYEEYPDVLKAIICNLSPENLAKIFIKWTSSYYGRQFAIEIIEETLGENPHMGFVFSFPLPNKGYEEDLVRLWGPNIYHSLIESLPTQYLVNIIDLQKILEKEDQDIRDQILIDLFNRLAKDKISDYNKYCSMLISKVLPKEVIDIISSNENPLGLSFKEKIDILGTANTNVDVFRNHFENASFISLDDTLTLFIKILMLGEDELNNQYIDIFENVLNSSALETLDATRLSNAIRSMLSRTKSYFSVGEYYDKLNNIIISFAKKQNNIRPEAIEEFADLNLMYELVNNIDEHYYIHSGDFFDNVKSKEMQDLLRKKIMDRFNNNEPISLHLLLKFTGLRTDFLNKENVVVEINNKLITILNSLPQIDDDFIEDKLIPNINQAFLRNITVDFGMFYPKHVDSLVDKLLEMVNKEPKLAFMGTIFNILPSINGYPNEKVSPKMKKLFELISPNILAVNERVLLESNDEIVINYVKNYLIPSKDFTTLSKYALQIFQREEYIDGIIIKIQRDPHISPDILLSKFSFNDRIEEALLQAIREGKVDFSNIGNHDLLQTRFVAAACENDVHNLAYFIKIMDDFAIDTYEPELLDIITFYIPACYGIDKDKFDAVCNTIGRKRTINFVNNPNTLELFNKPIEELKRFSEIIKPRRLTIGKINDVNTSLATKVYDLENPDVLSIAPRILSMIQNGLNEEDKESIINELFNYVPNNLNRKLKKHPDQKLLDLFKEDKREFLSYLIDMLVDNQNNYVDIFYSITTNYIIEKRNAFLATEGSIEKMTYITYAPETRTLYDTLFSYLLNNNFDLLLEIYKNGDFPLYPSYKGYIFVSDHTVPDEEFEKTKEILNYLHNPQDFKDYDKERLVQIKRNINKVKQEFHRIAHESCKPNKLPGCFASLENDEHFMSSVKREPIIPDNSDEMYELFIRNIALEPLFKNVISDKEKYTVLRDILDRYCFLEWGITFNIALSRLTPSYNFSNMVNFINAFNKIYDKEKTKLDETKAALIEAAKKRCASPEEIEAINNMTIASQITPYKIYEYTVIYSSMSNSYKLILGPEDSELIKENPQDNAAKAEPEERLQRACKIHLESIQNNEITIPSFIETVNGEDETHKLKVIVGNRAAPFNQTHGERTGACMRAFGLADELYTFCSTSKYAFHITFTDPETDEYVTRVSGFRNGNTVFLNQLRYSKLAKYTTDDVIEACKNIAKELIERTKDSSMPIENVVAAPCYALNGFETVPLSERDIKGDIYDGYLDVTHIAVILATTGTPKKPAKFIPNKDDQPIYEPVRIPPKVYSGKDINLDRVIEMQRVTAIKACLNHPDNPEYYKSIDYDYNLLEKQYEMIIIGQDWYVALDINGDIYSDRMEQFNNIDEFNNALNEIEQYKSKAGELHGKRI